jgi:redox-sensitive bicupin YhaK (pirin superfamily)
MCEWLALGDERGRVNPRLRDLAVHEARPEPGWEGLALRVIAGGDGSSASTCERR